ncbi:hypothetical protein Fmac_031261 [Flemingia macrophylla]|uniref:Uncharacterized protein n=1 Tax=Flemingia macrophylla TaxID=520843 RepID=A0ABD1L1H9_9FABA
MLLIRAISGLEYLGLDIFLIKVKIYVSYAILHHLELVDVMGVTLAGAQDLD